MEFHEKTIAVANFFERPFLYHKDFTSSHYNNNYTSYIISNKRVKSQ